MKRYGDCRPLVPFIHLVFVIVTLGVFLLGAWRWLAGWGVTIRTVTLP